MIYETYEIVQMYKEAKDKNTQIAILADLNACSKQEILSLLQEEGLISGVKLPKKARRKEDAPRLPRMTWTEELKDSVRRLCVEGLSNLEIAERLGMDEGQIKNAVTRFKLRQSSPEKGAERTMPKENKRRYALECVSLIRDYAKCIALISPGEIQNYQEIVGAFAGSIMEAADEILCEAKKYAQ